MKKATLIIIIGLLTYGYPQCKAQQLTGTMHSDDELLIFFDSYKNTLKNKKVSLIYFVLPRNTFLPDSLQPAIPDTVFFAIRKNGQLKYQLLQNMIYQPDSVWLDGYDTIAVGANCKQRYYCDCGVPAQYDSIVCNTSGMITFSRQAYTITKENIYSSTGLLIDQRMKNMSPDGSSVYKTFYKYDKYKRLIRIDFSKGQPSKKTKSPVTDIFTDFEFPVVTKTIFSYNGKGLLSASTAYWVDKNNKTVPNTRTSYIYLNDLLIRTEVYEYAGNEITYVEKVGYKFY